MAMRLQIDFSELNIPNEDVVECTILPSGRIVVMTEHDSYWFDENGRNPKGSFLINRGGVMNDKLTTELLKLAAGIREEDILLVGYGILEEAAERIDSAAAIMEKFVNKAETARARSKETYAEMKAWLEDE